MNNYPLFFKPSGFVAVERCRPKLPLEPKKPTLKLVKKNWFEDLILCFDGLDDERINAKRVEKYNRQMEVYKKELAAYKKQIKHILSSTEMCNFRRKEKERLLKQTRLGQLLSHDVKKGTSPKKAPTYQEEVKTDKKTKWRCKICGYIYEGDELPADFICPICGQPASMFEKVEN